MPAPRLFLSTKEISDISGMSMRSAQYLMKVFERQGRTIKRGPSCRGQMIGVDTFCEYICKTDGGDYQSRKADILSYLKDEGIRRTIKKPGHI